MQHYSDLRKLSLVLLFSQKILNLGFVSWIPTELFISFTMVTSLFAFWTDLARSLWWQGKHLRPGALAELEAAKRKGMLQTYPHCLGKRVSALSAQRPRE